MIIEKFKVQRTAHVYIEGDESFNGDYLWLVLHGYAQSPEDILLILNSLPGRHTFVIPEAFSKFYLKGFEGQVVSSWMTSKHRIDEIRDQKLYLDQTYARYFKEFTGKKICLGFSQGVATAHRWLESSVDISFDRYIIYAGWPPEDINYKNPIWSTMRLIYALGNKDYFLDDQRVEILKALPFFQKHQVDWIHFKGGHHLQADVLEQAFKMM